MFSEKLEGSINLSRIPKNLIRENKKGDKVIYVKILPNYTGSPDQYGNVAALTLYDAENKKAIYLGNFKPWEPEEKKEEKKNDKTDEGGDLPF